MKILITGGAGFIGSAVVRLAIAEGHSVVNLDSLTYAASLENVASVAPQPNYMFEKVDIRDRNALDVALSQHNPDAIMHLAAETHVDRSIEGPSAFIDTNIWGTFNMLEAARSYWYVKDQPKEFRFLHVSTDEVYGTLGPTGRFTEDTPYDPRSPYSASKASSDHLVRAWHHTYNLPILLSNCSNNYGPYHFPEKLIPVVIINALSGKKIPIYGDGSNIRDWLHVDDHASALLLILQQGTVGRNYNVGGENEYSNIELVQIICKIMDRLRPLDQGTHADLIELVGDRPGHDARYSIDPSLIKHELGWEPSVNFEQGIENTIKWFLKNESWWRPLLNRQGVGARLGLIPSKF